MMNTDMTQEENGSLDIVVSFDGQDGFIKECILMWGKGFRKGTKGEKSTESARGQFKGIAKWCLIVDKSNKGRYVLCLSKTLKYVADNSKDLTHRVLHTILLILESYSASSSYVPRKRQDNKDCCIKAIYELAKQVMPSDVEIPSEVKEGHDNFRKRKRKNRARERDLKKRLTTQLSTEEGNALIKMFTCFQDMKSRLVALEKENVSSKEERNKEVSSLKEEVSSLKEEVSSLRKTVRSLEAASQASSGNAERPLLGVRHHGDPTLSSEPGFDSDGSLTSETLLKFPWDWDLP